MSDVGKRKRVFRVFTGFSFPDCDHTPRHTPRYITVPCFTPCPTVSMISERSLTAFTSLRWKVLDLISVGWILENQSTV